jgi:hypothetical protein
VLKQSAHVQALRRQRQAKKERQKGRTAKGKATGRPAAQQVASAGPHFAASKQPAQPAAQQQQLRQAPAVSVSVPEPLVSQPPPLQGPKGNASQQQEPQPPAVQVAAQHRRRRLTRAAVRTDEPPQAPAAAPQLVAVPVEVPAPLPEQSSAQAENQLQPPQKRAKKAAQAPTKSSSSSPNRHSEAVVLEAAAAVAPMAAAHQPSAAAACNTDEQENKLPHPASPPPAKAAARHESAALTFCAWPHPEQGPCSGASDPCCPPFCSWYQEPAALAAGAGSASCCRPRRRCLGGWPSWTAAAAQRTVQTQLRAQPRARLAAAHWRSCAAATVPGRSGSGAARSSLGIDLSPQGAARTDGGAYEKSRMCMRAEL